MQFKLLVSTLVLCACLFLASCSSTTEPGGDNNGTTQDIGPSATAKWDPNFKYSGGDSVPKGLAGSVQKLVKYNGKLYGVGYFKYINGSDFPTKCVFVWNSTTIDSLHNQLGPVDVFYNIDYIRSAMVYNNKLHVSGSYELNGQRYISQWDGSDWTTGTQEASFSWETVSNGTSAYDFQKDQGATFPYDSSTVYKYNGTTWDAIAGFQDKGNTTEQVTSLAVDNSTVYVATHEIGSFVFDAKAWVYKYDGGTMTELKGASGQLQGTITKLLWVGSTLYGLGEIQLFKGYCGMVKWNGTDWETMTEVGFGANDQNPVMDAVTDKNGNLYVATKKAVFKYDGTTATKLGTVDGAINTIAIMGDKLFLGGSFDKVDGVASNNFAVLH